MIDLHVHSSFSIDSDEKMEDIVIEAIKRKIKIISFTDHIDYDYKDPLFNFEFNIEDYFEEIERLQIKYKSEIKIIKGLELGLQKHIIDELERITSKYDFDFIIGSFHTADGKDLYNGDYYNLKTPKETWDIYFDEIYETIMKFDNFSVIGHIDLVKRYSMNARNIDFYYYKNKVEKIFKLIISKKIGIEVNTSGLRGTYGLNETLPSEDILKLYYDCGGKIITIGSDSHEKTTLGCNFDDTVKVLKKIGFENIYIFENMEYKKINL
jgi:histidinol-phosphatase (PHP family)